MIVSLQSFSLIDSCTLYLKGEISHRLLPFARREADGTIAERWFSEAQGTQLRLIQLVTNLMPLRSKRHQARRQPSETTLKKLLSGTAVMLKALNLS